MPVFGADPDDDVKAWSEYEGHFVRRYVSKPVGGLTNYFGYHPKMTMSQIFNDEDKTALNAYFSRKLKQGVTEGSLKKIVDRFWQSWAADSQRPAYLFLSNKVQQPLLKEAEIVKDDPVLEWMLDGMPNNGPFEDPAAMRKTVLVYANEGPLRYPEVVADILRGDLGSEHHLLMSLEDVIDEKLNPRGGLHYAHLARRVSLPAELTGPGKIRPRYDTVQEAIANIPLHKKLEW